MEKQRAPFKLKSGNKPSIAKMAGGKIRTKQTRKLKKQFIKESKEQTKEELKKIKSKPYDKKTKKMANGS